MKDNSKKRMRASLLLSFSDSDQSPSITSHFMKELSLSA